MSKYEGLFNGKTDTPLPLSTPPSSFYTTPETLLYFLDITPIIYSTIGFAPPPVNSQIIWDLVALDIPPNLSSALD